MKYARRRVESMPGLRRSVLIALFLLPSLSSAASRCEIAADPSKHLEELHLNYSRAKIPAPGYRLAGRALGIDDQPLLLQLDSDEPLFSTRSEQLTLRPLNASDSKLDILFEFENDPQLVNYWRDLSSLRTYEGIWMPAVLVGELELVRSLDTSEFINEALVIEDREGRKLMGIIKVSTGTKLESYRISYAIFSAFRGRGVATQALGMAVTRLRARDSSKQISLAIDVRNVASVAVALRAGFKEDATFRYPDEPATRRFIFHQEK